MDEISYTISDEAKDPLRGTAHLQRILTLVSGLLTAQTANDRPTVLLYCLIGTFNEAHTDSLAFAHHVLSVILKPRSILNLARLEKVLILDLVDGIPQVQESAGCVPLVLQAVPARP